MSIDPAVLPRPFERKKAEDAINEVLNGKAADESTRALVGSLAGNSPYLARAMAVHSDMVPAMVAEGPDAVLDAEMARLAGEAPQALSVDALMKLLRKAKARIALLTAAADVAGIWPLSRVTGALTAFADLALGLAVARLLKERMRAGELAWPRKAEEPPEPGLARGSGLFVLAMGKLGAGELNYSSDIDLIVLYDEEVASYRGRHALSNCMVKLTQDLVRVMEARTAEGYVFRTDLRLRPDPGATPAALSVGAAETYYQSLALNWERAALIKARVVAGDIAAGEAYLERLTPFIWRRTLDFAAIEDIHAIKNQIHRHHGHRRRELPGYDIKLGPGGIREIEFYAQINQLIHGGREPFLRVRDTLGALDRLVKTGRVLPAVRDELARAYVFYRCLEHRLQMVNDAQTHKLPEDSRDLERIVAFMGYDDRKGFEEDLFGHLGRVEAHYDALLPRGRAPEEGLGEAALAELLDRHGYAAPDNVLTIVDRWRRGRYRALRTPRARKLLEATLPALLEAFGEMSEPDLGFARFDKFLSQLPSGVQLFALFQSNPSLFHLLARIMSMAPVLAEQLAKRAQLIDALLDPDFFAPLPARDVLAVDLDAALARARDYQDVLDIARRWTNERRFQLGVQMLEAIAGVREASEAMTDVAEVAIGGLLPAVERDYAARHGHFPGGALGIVAMGKFGGRELSFGSDLDVVLLYDVDGDAEQSDGPRPLGPSRYFSGLGQGFVTAVTSLTPEGRLWEMDTRLRPSGRAGPLVVTLETFSDYYTGSAWTWEHMALTRARVVAGPPALARRIEKTVSRTLTRGHDPDALGPAVAGMRRRLRDEFGTDNPWSVKHVRGGFVDLEFIVQYLLLREGMGRPDIFAPRLDDCIDNLVAAGALEEEVASRMKAAHALFHAVQGMLRLTLGGDAEEERFPPELRSALARAAGCADFATLRRELIAAEEAVAAIYERIVGREAAKEG